MKNSWLIFQGGDSVYDNKALTLFKSSRYYQEEKRNEAYMPTSSAEVMVYTEFWQRGFQLLISTKLILEVTSQAAVMWHVRMETVLIAYWCVSVI